MTPTTTDGGLEVCVCGHERIYHFSSGKHACQGTDGCGAFKAAK